MNSPYRQADPDMPDETTAEEDSRFPYWRRNSQLLPWAGMLSSMGFAVFVPFLPVMLQSLGVTEHLETWVGQMMLIFYIISFASGPVWGGIADHYGRKIMVLRAMLGMGVLMALVPFAPSPVWFVFLFALVGFCNGSMSSLQALLVANTPPKRIGGVLAKLQSGSLTGMTLGPALATAAVAVIAYPHWLFWISGGLLVTGGLMVGFYVHEVKQLASGPWRLQWLGSLRELLRVPRIGVLYMLSFIFAMWAGGNSTILSVYVLQLQALHDPGGSGAFWVGAVATAFAVSSVLSLTVFGRLLDRIDPKRLLLWATALVGLSQLPMLVLDTPLQLVLTRVAFGLAGSFMQPCIVRLLRTHAPEGMDARAISYNQSFHFMALGLAPFCAGLIGPVFGLRAYYAVALIATFAVLALWWRDLRKAG